MSRESRHLTAHIGRPVSVRLDRPERVVDGTLVELRRAPRVKFADGTERTVAAWRITRKKGAA